VPAAVPLLAKKTPTPVVLPPTQRPQKPVEPDDLFGDLLGSVEPHVRSATTTEPAGLATMRALAGFGLLVAKADGRMAQAERTAVRNYLAEKFGGDPVLVRHLDPTLADVEKAVPAEADAVVAVLAVVPESQRAELVAWAERIADASGERNAKEQGLLGRVRDALGVKRVEEEVPAAPVPKPVPQLDTDARKSESPRDLLAIEQSVDLSVDLIRRRYNLLTEKLDPVKAAALGAEFAALAEAKRAKLRAAAEELLKPFGEPLETPAAPPPADMRHNPDLDDAFGM
jgi:uncharacterized tellurite resistance protein B-like protein